MRIKTPTKAGRSSRRASGAAVLVLSAVLTLIFLVGTASAETVTKTFSYTGGEQTFEVPASVSSIEVVAVGGRGGSAFGVEGGVGAVVAGTVDVTPGQTLYVEVGGNGESEEAGGEGGFNGGGRGGPAHVGCRRWRRRIRHSHKLEERGLSLTPGFWWPVPVAEPGGRTAAIAPAGAAGPPARKGTRNPVATAAARQEQRVKGARKGGGGCGEGEPVDSGYGGQGSGDGFGGYCNNATGGGGGAGLYGGQGGSGGSGSLGWWRRRWLLARARRRIDRTRFCVRGTRSEHHLRSWGDRDHRTRDGNHIVRGDAACDHHARRPVTGCYFQYGPREIYEFRAPCEPESGFGESPSATMARIGGLQAKTKYHYRVVVTGNGETNFGQDEVFETLPAPPQVTAVSPPAGFEAGGNTVEISGSGFSEATAVKFGTTEASFKINSATSITATAPAQPAGTVNVSVGNAGGPSEASEGDKYVYVGHGHAPTITGLSAKSGPSAGGTTVVISGTSFVGVTSVEFGTTEAESYVVNSNSTITAVSPPETTGKVEITVSTPNGESGLTSKDAFTFGAPTITSLTPDEGPIPGGEQLTIDGSGFEPGGSGTAFKFGTLVATGINCLSTTTCTVTVPGVTRAEGVEVTATERGKTSARVSADRFIYQTPAIASIAPNAGPREGGTGVTVVGSGFAAGKGKTTFEFGKTLAIRVECPSSTECTMLTPAVAKPGVVGVVATVEKSRSSAEAPGAKYTYE